MWNQNVISGDLGNIIKQCILLCSNKQIHTNDDHLTLQVLVQVKLVNIYNLLNPYLIFMHLWLGLYAVLFTDLFLHQWYI